MQTASHLPPISHLFFWNYVNDIFGGTKPFLKYAPTSLKYFFLPANLQFIEKLKTSREVVGILSIKFQVFSRIHKNKVLKFYTSRLFSCIHRAWFKKAGSALGARLGPPGLEPKAVKYMSVRQ